MRSRWLSSPRARAWIAGLVNDPKRIAPANVDHGVDLSRVRRPYLYHREKGTLIKEAGGFPLQTPYTGVRVVSAAEVDIDHVVSLEEVAESGGSGWTRAMWDAYQGDVMCLCLAMPRVNRVEKRARNCVEWLPYQNVRWFLGDVALIKLSYGLTFTADEAKTIRGHLLG